MEAAVGVASALVAGLLRSAASRWDCAERVPRRTASRTVPLDSSGGNALN